MAIAPFSISELKSKLTGGGARQSLFQVHISFPYQTGSAGGSLNTIAPFMIKAASMPASQIGKIEVPYMGRKIMFGGDRTFEDWTVTVINDENFKVRHALEVWMNKINSHLSNTRDDASRYKAQANIIQYGKSGDVIREVTFDGIFPINLSAMDTDWNATDAIQDFQAIFAFDAWYVSSQETGNYDVTPATAATEF